MLAFGIKVAWFSLSLSGLSHAHFPRIRLCAAHLPSPCSIGLLGSFAALPAFAQALEGYLIPVLYLFLNFVLQGLFCLGEFPLHINGHGG